MDHSSQWTPAQQAQADAEAARGAALFQPSMMDTVLSNIKDAGTAEFHHLGNIGVGIAQNLAHGARNTPGGVVYGLAQKLMGPQQTIGGLVSGQSPDANPIASAIDKYAAKREQNYQKTQPNSPGTYIGAGMGELAPFVVGGEFSAGAKLGQAADAATSFAKGSPTLQRILSGVLQGGAIGANQPVTSGDFAQQKAGQVGLGAATGGALPVLGSLGRQAYGLVKPIVNPGGVAADFYGRLLGSDAAAVAARLKASTQLVPGSAPTSAQVGGSVPLVQAEKALANQSPDFKGAMMNRQLGNNASRLDAIQQVAGTDQTLAAAQQARRDAIDPFVSKYLTDSKPAARWRGAADALGDLASKPGRMSSNDFDAIQQASKIAKQVRSGTMQEDDAIELLKELGDSVSSKKAQTAFQTAMDAINNNMVDPSGVLQSLKTMRYGPLGVNPARADKLDSLISSIQSARNINGHVGTDMLDEVRQEAGKLARNASGRNGMTYGNANDSLVQAIDRVAPGYADYLATYARASQPITDQRAASGILDGVSGVALGPDQRPQLTLTKLNSLLKQANKGDYPMSPTAQDALGNVQRDLQRESVSNSVRTLGSDTAYNLQAPGWLASKFYGPNMQGAGPIAKLIGAGVGSVIPGVGTLGGYLGADKLSQFGAKRVMNAVQDLALNPHSMAAELDKLAKKNPRLAQYLGRLTQQQAAASTTQQITQQP